MSSAGRSLAPLLLAASVAAAAVSAGAEDASRTPDVSVRDAWIRLAPPGVPAAGYLVLENRGDLPRRVLSVSCACAARIELHRSSVEDGVARMEPVDAIEIPGGGAVELAPGALHLMVMGPTGLREGESVELAFDLDRGESLRAPATVRRQ